MEQEEKCYRCNRKLKHPKSMNGQLYGSVCIHKISNAKQSNLGTWVE